MVVAVDDSTRHRSAGVAVVDREDQSSVAKLDAVSGAGAEKPHPWCFDLLVEVGGGRPRHAVVITEEELQERRPGLEQAAGLEIDVASCRIALGDVALTVDAVGREHSGRVVDLATGAEA